MRESPRFPKSEMKRLGKAKEGYRRKNGDYGRRKNTEGDDAKSVGSSNDMPPRTQSCNSPTKSEDSEESSDQSASSANVGGSSSQSSIGSRGGQYGSSANKKHGIAGIKFQPGLRLEAKDLGNDIWYAVKVVEVDWEEEEILIHFEKWSQRYDEWIPMDSSRLRPVQNSGSKKSSKIFKVGDKVMATWSDSRKYPAKVKSVIDNDRYEVLFFDGFSKNIKGGRMTLLKDEELASIEQLKPGIGPSNDLSRSPPQSIATHSSPEKPSPSDSIGTKEERRERKRKLNVAELFLSKKRPSAKGPVGGRRGGRRARLSERESSPLPVASPAAEIMKERAQDRNVGGSEERFVKPKRQSSQKGSDEKQSRRLKGDDSVQKSEDSGVKMSKNVPGKFPGDENPKKEKGLSGENSKAKKEGEPAKPRPLDEWEPEGQPAYIFGGPRKSIIVADPRIPAGWTRHTIQRMSGHSAGKWDVFFVSPQGRKFRTRHELRLYYEDLGEPFPSEQFDFSLGRRRKGAAEAASRTPTGQGKIGGGAGRPRAASTVAGSQEAATVAVSETPVRRVKTLLPRVRPGGGAATPPLPSSPYPQGADAVASPPAEASPALDMGGLRIERENDAYKCPKDGCNKNFRKENLLQMHLKHYHPEYNRFVASTPNVADLAYARTVGEPIDQLPLARFEAVPATPARRSGGGRGAGLTLDIDGFAATSPAPPAPTPTTGHNSVARRSVPAARTPKREEDVGGEEIPSGAEAVAPKATIKTLLPVVRPVEPAEEGGPPLLSPAAPAAPTAAPPGAVALSGTKPVGQTKSLRTVRRRYMSDFHMEPLLKRRKTVKMPELIPEDENRSSGSALPAVPAMPALPATYRFSRKKMPVVHLEKLHVTTDSNEVAEPVQAAEASIRSSRVETLRREELINCTCGYPEEDGLMIQCDLCLCWQHGLCNNIEREEDVPEKYVCFICLHPSRERRSKRFFHDQDWLKEGALPSLSFRSKNNLHVAQREAILKRSHDLTGTLLQLRTVVHSLRVKVNIAENLNHPKLYLWARSWEKGTPEGLKTAAKPEQATENLEKDDASPGAAEAEEAEKSDGAEQEDKTLVDEEVVGAAQEEESHVVPLESSVDGSAEEAGQPVTANDAEAHSDGDKAENIERECQKSEDQDQELELPICQSELMDLATSMASSMDPALGSRGDVSGHCVSAAPVPPVPPRAPQPEAPIDPVECRLTLLDHIEHFQQQVESRLTSLETQVAALESMDPYLARDESADPRTKETVQMLLRDLVTMRDLAALN